MTPERWKRVETVFQGALDRQSAHRGAFLAEACGSDEELRREVESLLAAHAHADGFPTHAPTLGPIGLPPGTRLGRYEILEALGAGGMGEVYRARDTGLGREVAVKVLPRTFTADAERQRRFEQEARSAGRLNHPNVLAIHDAGQQDGTPYIVSELLEGGTLRRRLDAGPLPAARAVEYAVQTARGLAAAHARGIVHRDLKPDNLFVTRDGHLKILDFGLAAVRAPEGLGQSQPPRTEAGALLGTPGYMAPEQARGEAADARADVFALGAILFESLTGRKAFPGGTVLESLGALLRDDPLPVLEATPGMPPGLVRIVRRCLEKNPDERFQSARDLAFALEAFTLSGLAPPSVAPAPARRPRLRASLAVLAVMAAAVAYLAGAARPGSVVPSYRQLTFRRGLVSAARFSPDGNTVYYSAAWDGRPSDVFATRLDGVEARSLDRPHARLVATAPGEMALLRPKAGRLTLARVPLEGGAPRDVEDDVQDADWSPDGAQFAVVRSIGPRSRLEFPAGRTVYETAGRLTSPRVSPRGDAVAVVDLPMVGNTVGAVVVADASGARTLSAGWSDIGGVAWAPAGREVWFTAARSGNARALQAVSLRGRERLVARTPGTMVLQDVDRGGRVLLSHVRQRSEARGLVPGSNSERDLSWLDWTHATELSDDGERLLFTAEGEGAGPLYTLYLRHPLDATPVRLGDGHGTEVSPDGRWALTMVRTSPPRLMLLPTGAGEPVVLPHGRSFAEYHWAWWFPDGRRILFLANEAGRPAQLFVQDVPGGNEAPFAPPDVTAYRHKPITPDGRSVLVLRPDPAGFVLLPVGGGEARPVPGLDPRDRPLRWSPDGRFLFVRAPGDDLPVRIDRVDTASGHRAPWRELAPSDAAGIDNIGDILLTPDGRSYVYAARRSLAELYLVDGLQ